MYLLKLENKAVEDIAYLKKSGNKSIINKIENILSELIEHPETGIGKPERLKYSLSGKWSHRIDDKNRLIYKIDDNQVIVFVISAKGHYIDK
ncbi:MAG: Txe/YoeB family addiction module toxin [Salinivirgaceae bacterium]